MFQEEIGKITQTHIRTHIPAYLQDLQTRFADGFKLVHPKTVEVANLVGGVYNNITIKNMPAYAIDVITKIFSENRDNLWVYNYTGHIAGVVGGNDEGAVNKLCNRHEAAVEQFVKEHLFLHHPAISPPNSGDFSIIGLEFVGMALSGAEQIEATTWVAGFRVDLVWVVSETGPGQHGT